MDVSDLVEIALANSGKERVEVAALEPADISMEAVSGLAQLLSELVDNAIAFSEPDEKVRLTGLFQQDDYLLSVSDRGVGLPEHLIDELNRMLADPTAGSGPEPKMGIALVARLAKRHDIAVQLVPGVPGTTARVVVPGRLAARLAKTSSSTPSDHRLPARRSLGGPPPSGSDMPAASEFEDGTVDLTRFEQLPARGAGIVAMTEDARREAEAFLEKVFAPLVNRPGMTERPAARGPMNGNGALRRPEPRPESPAPGKPVGTVTALRVRVPGENFALVEDDPSTLAAEKAIDIRSALSKYEQGRRKALEGDSREEL
ncbi:MAG TPA: ATP-binding protein [Acidimicrobiia bacterium]|nr:ATP-binding protein [Acidimicrobiia bacterium]